MRINDPSYVAPDILRNRKNIKGSNEKPKKTYMDFVKDLDMGSVVREGEENYQGDDVEVVPAEEINPENYLLRLEMLKKKMMESL